MELEETILSEVTQTQRKTWYVLTNKWILDIEQRIISLPQDPAIPLLGIYPKEAPSYNKDICSTMFIKALFVIAGTWKQPRCPSTEEWIEKMWYIYTMEYYSVEKNNGFLKFAGKWMN